MSEPLKISTLEIQSFRGFRSKRSFNLNASAIIVSGANGSGKTSFFDAVQWLLLGSVARLEELKTRRADDYLANRYATDQPAMVAATLLVGDQQIEIRREGDRKSHTFAWKSTTENETGEPAEARLKALLAGSAGQDLHRLLMSSGVMQQDAARHVLLQAPSERYEHLATMLGLDAIAGFAAAARERAKVLERRAGEAQRDLKAAQQRQSQDLEQLRQLENERRLDTDVAAGRTEIAAQIRALESVVLVAQVPTDDAQAALLQESAQYLGEALAGLLRNLADIEARRKLLAHVQELEVRRLEAAAASAAEELARNQAEFERAVALQRAAQERSSQMSALAGQALQLLGPACPVCDQEIDEHDVRAHLESRLADDANDELRALSEATELCRQRLAASSEQHTASQQRLGPLRADYLRLQEINRDADTLQQTLHQFSPPPSSTISLSLIESVRAGEGAAIERTLEGLRLLWRRASELRAVLQAGPSHDQLLRVQEQVKASQQDLTARIAQTTEANRLWEASKVLRTAAIAATAGVTEQRFRELAPLIRDIYARLDPHPSFKDMSLEVGVYNGKPILTPIASDTLAGVEADPLLHFSSAQSNVAALSYFLALGWASGDTAIPFLLDDPVQSMDDVNVLGFADLCRHIRRERQLFVSTHDRRLAQLLERKLAPREANERAISVHFGAWTPDGPDVTQGPIEPQWNVGSARAVVAAAA